MKVELAAMQDSKGSAVGVEDGARVHEDALGCTYRFDLEYEVVLPDGQLVFLETSGLRWKAEILHRQGLSVLVVVERSVDHDLPDPSLRNAKLHADPWYLLEALVVRTEAMAQAGSASRPAIDLLDRVLRHELPQQIPVEGAVEGLNREQGTAVHTCAASPLWFVWGPPGTGKTSTLGALVGELGGSHGESVLIAAHSNVAVDATVRHSVQRLRATRVGRQLLEDRLVVRAGPAVLSEVKHMHISSRELALDKRPDLARRLLTVEQDLKAAHDGRSNGHLRTLIRSLREIRTELAVEERGVYGSARVLFCTMSKAVIMPEIADRTFDAAIVDEVSMALPTQVLFAASRASKRLSVFGDFRQLPPIVQAESPDVRHLLGRDVFTAAGVAEASAHEDAPGLTMLREQYRMHPDVRQVISNFAYHGKLRDGDGVTERTQAIAQVAPRPGDGLAWFNVALHGSKAWSDQREYSRFNPVSALWSFRFALDLSLTLETVVLLAPYRAQVRLLGALLKDSGRKNIQLGTVHRFQGAEGAAVVLDVVDAPPMKVGRPLLGEAGEKLLNVGMSRAQGKLLVVSNAAMNQPQPQFQRSGSMLRDIKKHEIPLNDLGDVELKALGMFWSQGFPAELAQLDDRQIVAAWLPPTRPRETRKLTTRAQTGREGHVIVIAKDCTWVCTQRPRGEWSTWRVASKRFANALSSAAQGSALVTTKTGAGEVGTVVARFDECALCEKPLTLESRGTGRVIACCHSCRADRWPSEPELTEWSITTGLGCPNCDGAMKAKRGPRRTFLGCETYPKCDGACFLEELVGRPHVPVEEQPRRHVPCTRKATSVRSGMTSSGFTLAQLAEFDDYGYSSEVAHAWLGLGFTPEQAIDLLNRRIDLASATEAVEHEPSAAHAWQRLRGINA